MSGAVDCLTCKGSHYLQHGVQRSRAGECAPKTRKAEDIKIIVANAANKDSAIDASGLVQTNIMMAILKAYELTTKHIGQKVQIWMETGTHFVRP